MTRISLLLLFLVPGMPEQALTTIPAGCLLQTLSQREKREKVILREEPPLDQALMGNLNLMNSVSQGFFSDPGVRDAWSNYQQALASRLATTLSDQQKVVIRLLLVTYVSDTKEMAQLWGENMKKLLDHSGGDQIDFGFFHYDQTNKAFMEQQWYAHPAVKIRYLGGGCPAMYWHMLNTSYVQQYDYIWMADADLQLGFFSWEVYRIMLRKLQPMVSQPAVVAGSWGHRSSDVPNLNMIAAQPDKGGLLLVHEAPRSETMTPVLSTHLWAAVKARLSGNELHTTWFSDDMWDLLALSSRVACNSTGIAVIDASPVRHLDSHALSSKEGQSAHCYGMGGPEMADSSNRPLDTKELSLGSKVFACDAAKAVLQKYQGAPVSEAHVHLAKSSPPLRYWTVGDFLA